MGRRRRAFLEHGLDLYAHGEHTIWTDPYIRRQLLLAQLDPETDAASRRPQARAAIDTVIDLARQGNPDS